MSESKVAIIPARGGSKRIPRKNIKDFLGRPIIGYSIEAARASQLFDEIMVSTDDNEIASIAIALGAKVPFMRSKENSTDYATSVDVLLEVLNDYKRYCGREFDFGCCIYPTAPFIKPEHLLAGFSTLEKQNLKSVFPIVAFSYPIWRGVEVGHDGLVKMVWPQYVQARSQDLKRVYHDAGQWYWFNCAALFDERSIFTSRTGSLILEESMVQDIDSLSDWSIAELKYQRVLEKKESNSQS